MLLREGGVVANGGQQVVLVDMIKEWMGNGS